MHHKNHNTHYPHATPHLSTPGIFLLLLDIISYNHCFCVFLSNLSPKLLKKGKNKCFCGFRQIIATKSRTQKPAGRGALDAKTIQTLNQKS